MFLSLFKVEKKSFGQKSKSNLNHETLLNLFILNKFKFNKPEAFLEINKSKIAWKCLKHFFTQFSSNPQMATHKRNISSHHHRQKLQNVKRKLTHPWQSFSRMPSCLGKASDAQLFHPATSILLLFFFGQVYNFGNVCSTGSDVIIFLFFFYSPKQKKPLFVSREEKKNFNYTSIWLRIQSSVKIDRLVWARNAVKLCQKLLCRMFVKKSQNHTSNFMLIVLKIFFSSPKIAESIKELKSATFHYKNGRYKVEFFSTSIEKLYFWIQSWFERRIGLTHGLLIQNLT